MRYIRPSASLGARANRTELKYFLFNAWASGQGTPRDRTSTPGRIVPRYRTRSHPTLSTTHASVSAAVASTTIAPGPAGPMAHAPAPRPPPGCAPPAPTSLSPRARLFASSRVARLPKRPHRYRRGGANRCAKSAPQVVKCGGGGGGWMGVGPPPLTSSRRSRTSS